VKDWILDHPICNKSFICLGDLHQLRNLIFDELSHCGLNDRFSFLDVLKVCLAKFLGHLLKKKRLCRGPARRGTLARLKRFARLLFAHFSSGQVWQFSSTRRLDLHSVLSAIAGVGLLTLSIGKLFARLALTAYEPLFRDPPSNPIEPLSLEILELFPCWF